MDTSDQIDKRRGRDTEDDDATERLVVEFVDTIREFHVYTRCRGYLTVYSGPDKTHLIATARRRKNGSWAFKWKVALQPEFYRDRVEKRIQGFMDNLPTPRLDSHA